MRYRSFHHSKMLQIDKSDHLLDLYKKLMAQGTEHMKSLISSNQICKKWLQMKMNRLTSWRSQKHRFDKKFLRDSIQKRMSKP